MNINNSPFLPSFFENTNGKLWYIFPTGEMKEVPPEFSEIHSQYSMKDTGHNLDYLKKAFWDKLNPLVREECEECHNKVVRFVISNNQKVFVCQCSAIKFGNKIS